MKNLLAALRAWWTRCIAAPDPYDEPDHIIEPHTEVVECPGEAPPVVVFQPHARTPEGPIIPIAKRERLRAEWDRVADAEPVIDEVRAI